MTADTGPEVLTAKVCHQEATWLPVTFCPAASIWGPQSCTPLGRPHTDPTLSTVPKGRAIGFC